MTVQEAIQARHSVRAYKELPLADEAVRVLVDKITELNQKGRLHMQLILNEPKAFHGTLAKYGKFRHVNNYIVMAGKKAASQREESKTSLGTTCTACSDAGTEHLLGRSLLLQGARNLCA